MRERVRGVLGEALLPRGRRPRERMVHRGPASFLLVALEHREVVDPEEREALVVDQTELAAEVQAQRAEDARGRLPRVGGEQDGGGGLAAESRQLLLGEELRDRGPHLALLVVDEVREPLRPPLLRDLLEACEIAAAELLRHAQEPHRLGAREHPELRRARDVGRVLELELEARVGLVRAEAAIGLLERHARERRLDLDPEALAPDAGVHALHHVVDELLVGEAHLDVELRDLLHAVGAQVLVPEADRDLVVAVEAGDHRQLLQDLRALRERVEAALLKSARHDEVPRALRSRLEEDRRLDVEEAGGLHLAPDDPDHLGAQSDVALEPLAAQVEPAVAQPQRLVDVLLVELERQRRRAADDVEPLDLELDLARRHVRVDGLRAPGDERALGAQHELVPDLVRECRRLGGVLGVDHDLRDAGAVAQVDEYEAAVVAAPVSPPGERDPLADELLRRLAAHVGAPDHRSSLPRTSAWASCSSSASRRRIVAVSRATTTTVSAPERPACVSWPLSERPA